MGVVQLPPLDSAQGFEQLAILPQGRGRGALPGRDRPGVQRERRIGDHQVRVEGHAGAEALARRAGAVGTVEAEGPRLELFVADLAVGAGIERAEELVVPLRDLGRLAAAVLHNWPAPAPRHGGRPGGSTRPAAVRRLRGSRRDRRWPRSCGPSAARVPAAR